MYWECGGWCSDEFRVYDMDDFTDWARAWPEMDYQLCSEDSVRIFPALDLDFAPSLPVYRYDPDTGDYRCDEERYEDVFLEELSWRVGVGETCVIKLVSSGWGEIGGHAIAIAGGEAQPWDRIATLSLDEIYGRAADRLQEGRLLITAA